MCIRDSYEDVHDMVNKYHDTTFDLICSNIKDFKFINEIFGMEKGNQVLIKQAKLMASNPSCLLYTSRCV